MKARGEMGNLTERMTRSKREEHPIQVVHDIRRLRVWSVLVWLFSVLLVHLASFLPLFDNSPEALLKDGSWGFASALLRWDVFHFAHVAREGYVYEHEWAFFPGTPFVLRGITHLLRFLGLERHGVLPEWSSLLIAGVSGCCFTGTTIALYQLTLHLTKSRKVAYLAALLSFLPSSPVTLHLAAYSESFFTFLSYKGMLYCAHSQWVIAAFCFSLAGTFRSNGFFLSGFIIWGLLVDPVLRREKPSLGQISKSILLTALIFVPFVAHHYAAFVVFCTNPASRAPWCTNTIPSVYTYAQSRYWNVGFLKYWTLSQSPNFLMCSPVLALLIWFTVNHIRYSVIPRLRAFGDPKALQKLPSNPFLSPSLNPHAIHAFAMTMMLLFASHTQIILRQAVSMPLTYWAAAYLLVEKPRLGKWWVGWCVVWGVISTVLWTTFLPPA